MSMIKKSAFVVALLFVSSLLAEQSTSYILTEFPVAAVTSQMEVWVKWAGMSSDPVTLVPDSGKIYFSKSPGGSQVENYTDSVTVYAKDSTSPGLPSQGNIPFPYSEPPQRGIKFKPIDQKNMGAGVYYFIVARRIKNVLVDTVYYSNELKMIVESDMATVPISPARDTVIDALTPTFKWNLNAGVPYYHVIVSDERIEASTEGDSIDIAGLSVIWQAITSNTQITYGAPDPSGTITANPPPISPGLTYSWVVLNNYGNHPAYTSSRFSLPETFSVEGEKLMVPVNVWPPDGDTINASTDTMVTFKWTNLDTANANTYQIYIYTTSELSGYGAQLVVWENEVTAGDFTGDTAEFDVNIRSILTNKYYTWRVLAVDDKGAGTAGEYTGFKYQGVPSGLLRVYTKENINVGETTLERDVSAVKITVEVLDGSMEAPILFYTDANGVLKRDYSEGTYRLTASKSGFESATKTVTVTEDDTTDAIFYLQRPDATVFGKVVDTDGRALNLVTVIGVSDLGDTVKTETDALGNFVLNCYEADWDIWAQKKAYVSSFPSDTSVTFGQSVDFGTIILQSNPFTLSGTIKNGDDEPLLGVNVRLYRDGVLIREVPSTPQTGKFSFSLQSGTYTVRALKTGFSTQNKTYDLVKSKDVSIIMQAGASLVRGVIMGSSWGGNGKIYAPVTNASVMLINPAVTPPDTFITVSDGVYGDYEISVTGGISYIMRSSAEGYLSHTRTTAVETEAGKTHTIYDTLKTLAYIQGQTLDTNGTTVISGVSVILTDTSTGEALPSVKSDNLGSFEIRNIPDGVYYVSAGKVGYTVNSIEIIDTSGVPTSEILEVFDGRPVNRDVGVKIIETVKIFLEHGDKFIKWITMHDLYEVSDATVKIKSPLQTNVDVQDTIAGMGAGTYVMTIDADADTIMDISRHTLVVPPGVDSFFIDTVGFLVAHLPSDSLSIVDRTVEIPIKVYDVELDSGYIYFRDINAVLYDSLVLSSEPEIHRGVRNYTFDVAPKRNGSIMYYYFKLYKDGDIFGYKQELYSSYIRPDTLTLTKIEITPSSDDTLLFPAEANIDFEFRGYFSSGYMLDSSLNGDYISWTLINGAGCSLNRTKGLSVSMSTPDGGIAGVAALRAVLDTNHRYVADGIDEFALVYFRVSENSLDSIRIVWTNDNDEKGYISTATLARAEFVAEGLDANGTVFSISPAWSVEPEAAGAIDNGVFDPASNFSGMVRVYADMEGVSNEYNPQYGNESNASGLEVHYIIPIHSDTLTNGRGCSIVFPDTIIDPGIEAEVTISIPYLKNRVEQNSGDFSVISDAFDISAISQTVTDLNFNISRNDSITLILDIPEAYEEQVSEGEGSFFIGVWDEDSLLWMKLTNSELNSEQRTICANIAHFSRYAVLFEKSEEDPTWEIKPNPFSPYVKPVAEYGVNNAQFGTCFEITPKSIEMEVGVMLDIYNVIGDPVLSADLGKVAPNATYYLWWDGKTNSDHRVDDLRIDGSLTNRRLIGQKMCRNGRYFAVLSIIDGQGDKKRFMKPVVILK